MSSIYGYTVHRPCGRDYILPLTEQNRRYGNRNGEYQLLDENSGQGDYKPQDCDSQKGSSALGCCLNHLSENHADGPAVIICGNIKAVFDALLYNRLELEAQLQCNDDTKVNDLKELSKLSDGELLFSYIQIFGFDSLKDVNGDFTGAIYDSVRNAWTLVRDHNGIRPLFYYLDHETFVFSTDIRGIIAFPGVDLAVNETNLYNLMMGYNELTLCETDYAHIHCLRPASWTVIDADLHKTEHIYWRPGEKKIRYDRPEKYAEELRRLVTDSIQRRLDAVSGPVGCELSGGLDSSVIAILIQRLGRQGRYFSWSYSPDDFPLRDGEDERKVIADICAQEGINCSYVKKNAPDEQKTVGEMLESLDVPYINTRYLSEGSAKVKSLGANVMFTGHGGDEGVSHRCNFYELWYQGEKIAFFRAIWNSTSVKDKRLLRFGYRVLHQFFAVHPHFKGPYKNRRNIEYFVTDAFKEKLKNIDHLTLPFAFDPTAYILQGGHRVRIDNAAVQGAENGVQYIFPYLDYRVLDYVLGIPRYCFQNGFTSRAIFREAFDDLMPESLRQVRYKDTASYRDYKPSDEEIQAVAATNFQAEKDLINYLENEFWSHYLDFTKLHHESDQALYTEEDIDRSIILIDGLLRCAMIQNLQERLAENHSVQKGQT